VDLYATLNPQQHAAVTAPDGPTLVLAGPGSGKTRVLTHRIAHLIYNRQVPPYQIIAVTFTNKAAGEMRERVRGILGDRLRGLRIGTFHALCAQLLRMEADEQDEGVLGPYNRNYLIYDTDDQKKLVAQAVEDIGVNLKRLSLTPYKVLFQISDAKNELVGPKNYPRSAYEDEVIARVYEQYQRLLQDNNAMDFDDLIMKTVLLLRENAAVREDYQRRFEHVLVDEFQDTNMAQYELVRLWGLPQQNVFVVGDEDQAIYGFRGADYRNVMRFRKDYTDAKTFLLEQNYRSTQIILDAARAVIDRNADRTPKHLFTDRTDGLNITAYESYDEREEAEFIVKETERLRAEGRRLNEIAVMYRTNMQSRALEQAFVDNRIPYRLIGGTAYYQRREVKDMLAYLRLIATPADSVSFDRVVNTPRRGIGAKTQASFETWASGLGIPYGDALLQLVDGATVPDLSAGGNRKLANFGAQLRGWKRIADTGEYVDLLDAIIEETGYEAHLAGSSKTDDELFDRKGNIEELRGLLDAGEFETLTDFLTNASLSTDMDRSNQDEEQITLLTLHASKGLEYDVVFLTGLEEGLLPHQRALEEIDGVEEERRLLYVGITRARHRLYITRAFRRRLGQYADSREPSRFLYDLPASLIDGAGAATKQRRHTDTYYRNTQWDARSDREFYGKPRKPDPDDKIIKFPAGGQQFSSGMNVRHTKFGEGVVIESKLTGGDEEITVAFAEAGIKRLMASFANLEVVDG
jgi:DNA helicase II / ATP-dependent DNA helicase PcrA